MVARWEVAQLHAIRWYARIECSGSKRSRWGKCERPHRRPTRIWRRVETEVTPVFVTVSMPEALESLLGIDIGVGRPSARKLAPPALLHQLLVEVLEPFRHGGAAELLPYAAPGRGAVAGGAERVRQELADRTHKGRA